MVHFQPRDHVTADLANTCHRAHYATYLCTDWWEGDWVIVAGWMVDTTDEETTMLVASPWPSQSQDERGKKAVTSPFVSLVRTLLCSLFSFCVADQIHRMLVIGLAYQECLSIIRYAVFIGCQWPVSDQNQMRTERVWNLQYTVICLTVTSQTVVSHSRWLYIM